MKHSLTAVTTSLLLAGTMTLAATVSADGHETVDSLKAELAGLTKKFGAVTKDRDALYSQLLGSIEEIEALEANGSSEAAGLQKTLEQVTAGRNYLSERLLKQMKASKEMQTDLQAELDSANKGRDYIADRLDTLHTQNKAANSAQAAELAEAQAAQAELQAEVESTNKGRDYIAGRLETLYNQNKATNAAHAEELAKAQADGDSIAEVALTQIKSALAERNAARDAVDAEKNKNNFAAIMLKKAQGDAASNGASAASLQAELAATKAELSAMKEKSAMAAQAANWGNNVSASLSSQLGHLSGLEVAATSDNKVNIRMAGTGMFKSGGKKLSSQGKYLLEQVGLALVNQSDANILIAGHTDNIPTGKNSQYKDNVDLSNQRAAEAMGHLNSSAGIDSGRMASAGVGDAQPVASNATSAGREMNRRVEIILSSM